MAEDSEHIASLDPMHNNNAEEGSVAPAQADNRQTDLLTLAKEGNEKADLMASAIEEDGRVDSLAPTKEDSEKVDSLAPTKEDAEELAERIAKVDVAADTVVTPTKLTLIYRKDTPTALSKFFPKVVKKVLPTDCCHIGRSDDAHVYLNGDEMSRDFGEIRPMVGDMSKFILTNVSKAKIVQVVYSKGKKTKSKILTFNESMPIQTNYLVKFHTLEFKVEVNPGDVSSEYYELEVVQEVKREQENGRSRTSPVLVNTGQINKLYMSSNPVDTNSGPVHMAMSNYGPPAAVPHQYGNYNDPFWGATPQNNPNYGPGLPQGQYSTPQNFMTNRPNLYHSELHPYSQDHMYQHSQGHRYQHSQGHMNNGFPLSNYGHFENGQYGLGNPGHHMHSGYPGPPVPNHPTGGYPHPAYSGYAQAMQPNASTVFHGHPPYRMDHPAGHPQQATGKDTSFFCPTPVLRDPNYQFFHTTPEMDSLVGASGKVQSDNSGAGRNGPRVAQEIVRAPVENSELPDPIARLMQKADP